MEKFSDRNSALQLYHVVPESGARQDALLMLPVPMGPGGGNIMLLT